MAEEDFRRADATMIAHNCSIDVLGNDHELAATETLYQYGMRTGEQLSLLRKDIRENGDFGLPFYQRSIDPNALKNLTTDWTIDSLSSVIYNDSFSLGGEVFADFAPSGTAVRKRNNQSGSEYSRETVIQIGVAAVLVGFVIGFIWGRR